MSAESIRFLCDENLDVDLVHVLQRCPSSRLVLFGGGGCGLVVAWCTLENGVVFGASHAYSMLSATSMRERYGDKPDRRVLSRLWAYLEVHYANVAQTSRSTKTTEK